MKKPLRERFGDFMDGKGFYIVLFLCVAAIGISGYYLFSAMGSLTGPDEPVAGTAQVTVTPTPRITPAPPEVSAAPAVLPTPQANPVPTADPSHAPESSPSPTPVVTSSVFTWPLKGEILTEFSVETLAYDPTMGDWRTHSGLDIAAAPGTQVMAAAGGTVIDVVQDDLMGTTVYLDHGTGVTSVYSNLASVPSVEIGDTVSTGTVLGSVGDTAIAERSLPDHLHFEMTQDGSPVDPRDFLPEH